MQDASTPSKVWEMRHTIFGLGLLQVLITGCLFTGIGLLLNLSLGAAFVIGFGLSLSSTAFGVQILQENKQFNTTHGQGAFSILMFQDLAIVPLLAMLAFFGDKETALPNVVDFLRIIAIVGLLIVLGRFAIRHVLRLVADSRAQEVFTAMTLLIVLGTAVLVEFAGLSMAMGAFLAGVLLANSEYRHELETNIQPFKGLLMGLFFMAVGMSLDLSVIWTKPLWLLLIAAGFLTFKALIIWALGRLFRFSNEASRNMAFTLPQGGEFAFVLLSAALDKNILPGDLSSLIGAAVTISMALTPFLFSINQRMLRSFSEINEKPDEVITASGAEVIIAGFGRFGQIVSRILKTEGVNYTILEHSTAQVEVARKYKNKVFYGDASREDILEAAGAKDAKMMVLAIDDVSNSLATAAMVRKKFPHMNIIARARNRQHAIDLMELGVDNIHRETFLTSLEVAKEVMLAKGESRQRINQKLAKFRTHDEQILRNQFDLREDQKKFLSYTLKASQELDDILKADLDQK